jgi:site-specific recombinase XerD
MTIVVDNIRRITLRVPSQLHQALTQAAAERDVSLNHLAVEALELYLVQERELALSEAKGRFPLKELSDLLAPAAQARGLTEEEVMRHVKEARRRIWQERYREMAERPQKAQAT